MRVSPLPFESEIVEFEERLARLEADGDPTVGERSSESAATFGA